MPLSGDPVYGALAPEVHPRQPLPAPQALQPSTVGVVANAHPPVYTSTKPEVLGSGSASASTAATAAPNASSSPTPAALALTKLADPTAPTPFLLDDDARDELLVLTKARQLVLQPKAAILGNNADSARRGYGGPKHQLGGPIPQRAGRSPTIGARRVGELRPALPGLAGRATSGLIPVPPFDQIYHWAVHEVDKHVVKPGEKYTYKYVVRPSEHEVKRAAHEFGTTVERIKRDVERAAPAIEKRIAQRAHRVEHDVEHALRSANKELAQYAGEFAAAAATIGSVLIVAGVLLPPPADAIVPIIGLSVEELGGLFAAGGTAATYGSLVASMVDFGEHPHDPNKFVGLLVQMTAIRLGIAPQDAPAEFERLRAAGAVGLQAVYDYLHLQQSRR